MAFTEFTCRSGGSNLSAGSLDGSAEASTTPLKTYTNGGWNSGTGVFTPASGNPVTDGVAVGQWVSVYTDGASAPTGFVARVTAVSTTTITLSTTAKSGTAPTTGGSGITAVVGGAWLGPTGASGFPLNFVAAVATNSAGNKPRCNFKNDQTYSITAGITVVAASSNYVRWEGYSATFGDGGRAILDGGTSGASYALLTFPNTGTANEFFHWIFRNNGATGSAAGLTGTTGGTGLLVFSDCVFHDFLGPGFYANGGATTVDFIECEFYACNTSNTANFGGVVGVSGGRFERCTFHDNAGSNASGAVGVQGAVFYACIFDTNGQNGIRLINNTATTNVIGCEFYNNAGSGIANTAAGGTASLNVSNSNFLKNGAYGIDLSGGCVYGGTIVNCGFGSGTQVNTSGATNILAASGIEVKGAVTYAADVTPWVDPANGDFRISLAAAKGAGRGTFTQTAASYTGTVGYRDIGAAQHQDSGGGTTLNLYAVE
jgi:hypothetical protein